MAVRASDKVTLAVLPAVSYVRPYYLLQASNLAAPAKPTTNPPGSTWDLFEPDFTMGSTDTLYTTMLIGYGEVYFEYGEVQKSTSYEAAKQAYNQAVTAATQAGQALTSANGKNTNWYQNDPPAGTAHKLHDCWFDLNDANRMYRWNGTAWTSTQFGNNAFSAIDAGKISTGTLNALRIAAKSLTVDKLVIGDITNLIPDPYFDNKAQAMPRLSGNVVPVSDPSVPQTDLPSNFKNIYVVPTTYDVYVQADHNAFEVKPGDKFYVDAWVSHTGVETAGLSFRVWCSATQAPTNGVDQGGWSYPGTTVSAASAQDKWIRHTGVVTIPEINTAGTGIKTAPKYGFAGLGPGNKPGWLVGFWSLRRMTQGELIVDGTILARHVEMDTAFADKFWANEGNFGKINTNMITSDFGSQLNILSNEGITFIAGELATQSDTIADLDLVANDALSTAQSAETDVETALATAETANGAALLAKASADGANDRITEHQSVFKITPTGAVISTVNAEQELRLNPSSIELAQNGIAISRWEAGRFIVNETIMNKAQIAEHSFEVYSAKRTIIRPI